MLNFSCQINAVTVRRCGSKFRAGQSFSLRIATVTLTMSDKHVNEKILDMYYELKFPKAPPQLVSSPKYHEDPIAVLLGVNPSIILARVFKLRLFVEPVASAIAHGNHFFHF